MATLSERLAAALKSLHDLQARGRVAIRSVDLSRVERERLTRAGFLQEVMKGWYIATRPDAAPGETTPWYASYWRFCAQYLEARFGAEWSVSPEQSLRLHAGDWSVPGQLLVRADRAGKQVTRLLHGTSLLDVAASRPQGADAVVLEGVRAYARDAALVAAAPGFYRQSPVEARAVLASVEDGGALLARLLTGGHSHVAGRLAGAFRAVGQHTIADNIAGAMGDAGYDVRVRDPFEDAADPGRAARPLRPGAAPVANRVRLMWSRMRDAAGRHLPPPPGPPADVERYLSEMDAGSIADAYHSLSIEGYRVSPALIERVRDGGWDPESDPDDRGQADALAARGYLEAFGRVRESVARVLRGEHPATVARADHPAWYRALFAPSVTAGLLPAAQLAGYRTGAVFIRNSMHVPPRAETVRDGMEALFDEMLAEPDVAARAVLAHFFFVFVHPYPDGNGRMGRFLMNLMMAGAGYPWTVIRVEDRAAYMAALEAASVGGDIEPFARLVGRSIPGSG